MVITYQKVRMKIYFGMNTDENRTMYAVATGQTGDGTTVYTECEATADGAVVLENGVPKLIPDNQYTRRLRYGWQTFHRV